MTILLNPCPICLETDPIPNKDLFKAHPLSGAPHIFHKDCIKGVRDNTPNSEIPCPLCRRDISTDLEAQGLGRSAEEIEAARQRVFQHQREDEIQGVINLVDRWLSDASAPPLTEQQRRNLAEDLNYTIVLVNIGLVPLEIIILHTLNEEQQVCISLFTIQNHWDDMKFSLADDYIRENNITELSFQTEIANYFLTANRPNTREEYNELFTTADSRLQKWKENRLKWKRRIARLTEIFAPIKTHIANQMSFILDSRAARGVHQLCEKLSPIAQKTMQSAQEKLPIQKGNQYLSQIPTKYLLCTGMFVGQSVGWLFADHSLKPLTTGAMIAAVGCAGRSLFGLKGFYLSLGVGVCSLLPKIQRVATFWTKNNSYHF